MKKVMTMLIAVSFVVGLFCTPLVATAQEAAEQRVEQLEQNPSLWSKIKLLIFGQEKVTERQIERESLESDRIISDSPIETFPSDTEGKVERAISDRIRALDPENLRRDYIDFGSGDSARGKVVFVDSAEDPILCYAFVKIFKDSTLTNKAAKLTVKAQDDHAVAMCDVLEYALGTDNIIQFFGDADGFFGKFPDIALQSLVLIDPVHDLGLGPPDAIPASASEGDSFELSGMVTRVLHWSGNPDKSCRAEIRNIDRTAGTLADETLKLYVRRLDTKGWNFCTTLVNAVGKDDIDVFVRGTVKITSDHISLEDIADLRAFESGLHIHLLDPAF